MNEEKTEEKSRAASAAGGRTDRYYVATGGSVPKGYAVVIGEAREDGGAAPEPPEGSAAAAKVAARTIAGPFLVARFAAEKADVVEEHLSYGEASARALEEGALVAVRKPNRAPAIAAAVVLALAFAALAVWGIASTRPVASAPQPLPAAAEPAEAEEKDSPIAVTVEADGSPEGAEATVEIAPASGGKAVEKVVAVGEATVVGEFAAGSYEVTVTEVPEGFEAPGEPKAVEVDGKGGRVRVAIELEASENEGDDGSEAEGSGSPEGASPADGSSAAATAQQGGDPTGGSSSGEQGGGSPSGGSSGGSSDPAPAPAPSACSHDWVPETTTVWLYRCTTCGKSGMTYEQIMAHLDENLGVCWSWGEYPEAQPTGNYCCSKCGAYQ